MNRCDCVKRRSIAEIEISEYVKTIYDRQILTNYRQLTKFELDVFLPDIKIGFEYNGVYWHSDKPIDYHLNKTNKCKQLGITLYHIFEYDYINKPNVIKDIIKQAIYPIVIDGAKLTKTSITNSQYVEFVNQYNLQQPNFSDHIVGLVDKNNDLVATLSYTIEFNNVDVVQYTTKHSIVIRSLFEQLFTNCQITVKTNTDYQQQIPFMNDSFKITETIDPQPTYTHNVRVLTEQQARLYNNCNCTYNCGFQVLTKDLI